MKSLLYPGICLIVLWTAAVSCNKAKIPGDNTPEPVLLAQVFDYKLYFDDIKDLIQGYANAEDSIQQVRSLTEHWVRDRLILVEAEKKFPKEGVRKLSLFTKLVILFSSLMLISLLNLLDSTFTNAF